MNTGALRFDRANRISRYHRNTPLTSVGGYPPTRSMTEPQEPPCHRIRPHMPAGTVQFLRMCCIHSTMCPGTVNWDHCIGLVMGLLTIEFMYPTGCLLKRLRCAIWRLVTCVVTQYFQKCSILTVPKAVKLRPSSPV